MTQSTLATRLTFRAKLMRPASPSDGGEWAFVVLPKKVSAKLPRRGRTTVAGSINKHAFQATLDPDGKLSHWLRIDKELLTASRADIGETAEFEIVPVGQEPEPGVPADLQAALSACAAAHTTWQQTTTIARLDWIHWITSAKQEKTRSKRIKDACEMLASGKKRVCCFDPSGYYSKALRAPDARH